MLRRLIGATALAGLLGLVACTPAATETPLSTPRVTTPAVTPTPSETPTPTETTPTWSDEQQAAVDTVQKWYEIYNEAMRGERGAGDFVLAGRGKVVSEAGRTYNEFGLAELTVEGEILISALEPAKPTEKERQTVLVDLCEDTRSWRVLDKDGNDALSLESKVVRPLVATVEEWPADGWYVTSITGGKQSC